MESNRIKCDVLVIGAGPAGASASYWLAKSGFNVMTVERKKFPREKTCGDGLTPRSVYQLEAMGMAQFLATTHKYQGLRTVAFGKEMELTWPSHPELPEVGYVVTRYRLDEAVAMNAVDAGTKLLTYHEAVDLTLDDEYQVRQVEIVNKATNEKIFVEPRYLIVADGSNSRIGRMLGASRDRDLPMGLALRGYFSSPLASDPYIESHLDIRSDTGEILPGYGWIFPLGDGRVNAGIGLLSTLGKWKEVNTTKLMEAFVKGAPKRWGLSIDDPIYKGTGGKLPMGLSISPRSGGNYLMAGDATGSINPMNGEGIAYGYETGRAAASIITDCISLNDPTIIARYNQLLEETYGEYYKFARSFVKLIGNPMVMRTAVGLGINSKVVMRPVVRIMANLMRPDHLGPSEALFRAGVAAIDAKDRVTTLLRGGSPR
ncbi:MAG: geranylgeranyl reductase family protein [Actinomycetota bacterium]|nr:geranylgeranyl reductase family protein [Actinomycetota bacterium]